MFKLNFLKFKKTEICKKLIIFQAVLIFLNISTPAFSNSIELSPDEIRTINIYEKTNPSIVSIEADMPEGVSNMPAVIIPRKTIGELTKLLAETQNEVNVSVSQNQVRFSLGNIILASRLIDGNYPAYERGKPCLCFRGSALPHSEDEEL